MAWAYLHLRRESQWLSRFRRFRVMLDGECIDTIGNGASRTYEIAPGEHELAVMIDWVSSERVGFRCEAGQEVRFVCGHPAPTWRTAFAPHSLVSSIDLVPENADPR